MRVSPKTVGTYRARIKEKLGIGSGTELMRCAVQLIDASDRLGSLTLIARAHRLVVHGA